MFEKVKELIAENLDLDAETLSFESNFKEDLKVDSLDLFEMILAFEEEFDVEIPSDALADLQTVGDVVKYIEANA